MACMIDKNFWRPCCGAYRLGSYTVRTQKVKFTYTTTMSASRVGGAEGMDVDEAGVAPPTNEWMEAARKAAVRRHGRHPDPHNANLLDTGNSLRFCSV